MTKTTASILKAKSGILLDVSLGGVPQEGSVVLSVDLKHSPLKLPLPLPDGCVHTAVVTHVLEYLDPQTFFAWWDEMWRVVRHGGLVHVTGPYGGDDSHGWISDPMHRTRVVEATFGWLDPRTPIYGLHAGVGRKAPRPWHPLSITRVPNPHGAIGYQATLQKTK